MSYGFIVYNSSGEIVIDDKYPVFVVSQRQTLTGTFYVNNSTYGTIYKYTQAPTNELLFWRLPSTNKLIYRGALNQAGANGWFANQATIEVIRAKPVSTLSAGTGYGINIFNSSGQVTYRADQQTFIVRNVFTLTFDQADYSCSDEWFCIPNAHNGIYEVSSGGTFYYKGTGVLRSSATTIRSFDNAGPTVTPPPFIVLAAPNA